MFSFSHSTRCSDICAVPYFLLPLTIVAVRPLVVASTLRWFTHDLACAACLAVHLWFTNLLNMAMTGSNHTPSFSPSISYVFAHFCQQTSLACLIKGFFVLLRARILHTDHSAMSHPQKLPTWPGPLTFIHEVASHTCLFHASLMSSSQCSIHTDRGKKRGCSISTFLRSMKRESETGASFPWHQSPS